MPKSMPMPKLGVTMEEGRIAQWVKNIGEPVEKGEVLVVIESDKVALEYESPESGILFEIVGKQGDVIQVGEPICIFIQENEGPSQALEVATMPEKPAFQSLQTDIAKTSVPFANLVSTTKLLAVPLVRKMAKEKGVDLSQVPSTGPGGRISKKDLLDYIENLQTAEVSVVIPSKPMGGAEEMRRVKDVIPLTGIRGTIARRMTESILQAPQGTQFLDVDMTETIALKEIMQDGIKEKTGYNLSMTALLIKTVAKALGEHAMLNSVVEDNQVKLIENINMGIAVGMDDGLVVPVIHNVQDKSLADIVRVLTESAKKAKEKKLSALEMSGGTFTISNLGMFGIGYFTPLINPPESAILGVGSIQDSPVIVNGEIVVRPIMKLALTIDHRSLDGVPAAKFFRYLKQLLETPWRRRIIDTEF